MKDEKILDEEVLSDEELEKASGGDEVETFYDGYELYRRGLLSFSESLSSTPVRELIHKMGYDYKDYGGLKDFGGKDNEYFNKQGVSISREEFWKNFDAENGTKIIR